MPGDAQLPTTSAGRLIEFLYPTRDSLGVAPEQGTEQAESPVHGR